MVFLAEGLVGALEQVEHTLTVHIGLAAIQIAEPVRLITMDLVRKEGNGASEPRAFINPEIVASSSEMNVYEEGCLSIPEYYEEVERPAKVRVKFLDRDGKQQELDCDGLLATCIQHEIDHLNGVLFIDYLSRLKRERAVKKFAKAAKRGGGEKEAGDGERKPRGPR